MNTDPERMLLKILTGPHAGAEVILDPGEYVLGSADDSDLIIQDSAVAPRHMSLTIEGGNVSARKLDMPFFVDSRQSPEHIDPYAVVTMGTTCFALGPEDGNWPELVLPDMALRNSSAASPKEHEEEKHLAEERETSDEQGQRQQPSDELQELREQSPAAAFSQAEAGQDKADQTAAGLVRKARGKAWLPWLVVAGVLLLLAFTFLQSWRMTALEEVSRTPQQQREALEKALRGLDLNHVRLQRRQEGGWSLSGYVPTHRHKRLVRDKLEKLDVPVVVQLWPLDGLRRSVQQVLDTRVTGLQAQVENDGKLVLSGYARDVDTLDKVVSELQNDVPGLGEIRVQALTGPQAVKLLRSIMQEQNLQAKISLTPQNDHILASGTLPDKQARRWRNVLGIFLDRGKQDVIIKSAFGDSPAPSAQPPDTGTLDPSRAMEGINVVSVSVKPIKYFTTSSDERYFLGSKLANGFVLHDIGPAHLVVAKNGETALYPLGGER